MSLTPEQKAKRRTGIGGSEIAAVLGEDPYKTPLDVWLAKVEGYEVEDTPAMERGRFLEAGVAAWYSHRTGARLEEPGTCSHPHFPLALCTPDRLAYEDNSGVGRLVSIKVPGPHVREQWGEQWTDEVPRAYLLQLQWEYQVLSGLGVPLDRVSHLTAPIEGDLRIYHLPADPELQGWMLEGAEKFWRDFVETGTPPPLDGSASWTAWLSRRFPRDSQPMVQVDAHGEVLALELQAAEASLAQAELAQAKAANAMKELIGEAAGASGAFGRVTWKANKKGVRSFRVPKEWKR